VLTRTRGLSTTRRYAYQVACLFAVLLQSDHSATARLSLAEVEVSKSTLPP
jgi:hypothetical protein